MTREAEVFSQKLDLDAELIKRLSLLIAQGTPSDWERQSKNGLEQDSPQDQANQDLFHQIQAGEINRSTVARLSQACLALHHRLLAVQCQTGDLHRDSQCFEQESSGKSYDEPRSPQTRSESNHGGARSPETLPSSGESTPSLSAIAHLEFPPPDQELPPPCDENGPVDPVNKAGETSGSTRVLDPGNPPEPDDFLEKETRIGPFLNRSPLSPSESTSGRYQRQFLHSRGGFGQVWAAWDPELQRVIALKELRDDGKTLATDIRLRFMREAQITGQLEHPNIVPVHEFHPGHSEESSFYTMRLVKGTTFHEAIEHFHGHVLQGPNANLEFRRLLESFCQVCRAIAYAHNKNVIHRDIKGQNVILGNFGEVVVLDWGLAKWLDGSVDDTAVTDQPSHEIDNAHVTQAGRVMGTPAYMAPEQASGDISRVGKHSDIYALGGLLYELLIGQPAFTDSNTNVVLKQVLNQQPTRPTSIRSDLPKPLEAIALKALAKQPSDRYATANNLADDVQCWLADEPVSAYPESPLEQVNRWTRRHRGLMQGLLLSLIITVVVLVISTVWIQGRNRFAQQQREFARQTVDNMYTRLAESWLEDRLDPSLGNLDPLQRDFLRQALSYYQTFADTESENFEQQQRRSEAYLRVGDIQRKFGQFSEAIESYQDGLDVIHGSPSRPDSNEVELQWLAKVRFLERVAEVKYLLDDLDEASAVLDQAKGLLGSNWENRTSLWLNEPDLVARTLLTQANLEFQIGNWEDAEAQLFVLIDHLSWLSRTPELEVRLIDAKELLSRIARKLGNRNRARSLLEEILGDLQILVDRNPGRSLFRAQLAHVYNQLGLELLDRNATDEALDRFRQSTGLYAELAKLVSNRSYYQASHAGALINQGLAHLQFDDRQQARATLSSAIAILRDSLEQGLEHEAHSRYLIAALSNLAQIEIAEGKLDLALEFCEEALGESDLLINQASRRPDDLYRHAKILDNYYLGLYRSGNFEEAETALRDALKVSGQLVRDNPRGVDYLINRHSLASNLGIFLLRTQRSEEARPYFKMAAQDAEALVNLSEPTATDRLRLATSYDRLAELPSSSNASTESQLSRPLWVDSSEAHSLRTKAVQQLETLVSTLGDKVGFQLQRAVSWNNLAEEELERFRLQEAHQALDKAQLILSQAEDLLGETTPITLYISSVLETHQADLLSLQGKLADERQLRWTALKKSQLAIEPKARNLDMQQNYYDCLANLILTILEDGETQDLVNLAGPLFEKIENDPDFLSEADPSLQREVNLIQKALHDLR